MGGGGVNPVIFGLLPAIWMNLLETPPQSFGMAFLCCDFLEDCLLSSYFHSAVYQRIIGEKNEQHLRFFLGKPCRQLTVQSCWFFFLHAGPAFQSEFDKRVAYVVLSFLYAS